MEKLLNLLNEYEEKRIKKINADGKLRVKLLFKPYTKEALTNQAYQSVHNEIISKYYGFIQRLVEKDKIDTDAYKTVYSGDLDKRKTLVESRDGEEIYKVTEHGVYESLLMLLSIQANPISFLVSILK